MNLSRIEKYLERLKTQIYNEPRCEHHTKASIEVVNEFCGDLIFDSVIELGCGNAPILDEMKKMGKKTLGVTLGGETSDHEVLREDMHCATVADSSFDMVVARHVLEHSPMPLLLLMEMRRIAVKYALVVLPEPTRLSIDYPNHYSVFRKRLWEKLFGLAGFKVVRYKKARYYFEDVWFYEYRWLLKTV